MTEPPNSARLRATLSNGGARDVLVALEGLKAARIAVPAPRLGALIALLQGMGLAVAVSPEVSYMLKDRGKGGWSNLFAMKRGGDPHRILYAAKYQSMSEEAARAESLGDDAALGRLLAIPECCQLFYSLHSEAAMQDQGDLLPFFAPLAWQHVSTLLNLGGQYFDMAFISHFPCSCGCMASGHLAERQAQVVERHDPEWARETRCHLRRVCVYTEEEGVFLLRSTREEGNKLWYANDDIYGTSVGRINDMLAAHSALIRASGGAIILRSEDGLENDLTARNLRVLVPDPSAAATL